MRAVRPTAARVALVVFALAALIVPAAIASRDQRANARATTRPSVHIVHAERRFEARNRPAARARGAARRVAMRSGKRLRRVARQRHPRLSSLPQVRSLATATSRTYALPTGRYVTRISPVPVNFRDGHGAWRPIDNRLTPTSHGSYRNAANSFTATIPAKLGAQPVRFAAGGASLGFELAGAQGAGKVAGATASFGGALPGTDVEYLSTPTALKELVTLHGGDAPEQLAYDLHPGAGLTPRRAASGAVELVDSAGAVRLTIAAPYAYEAGHEADTTHPVATALSGGRLVLTPDRAWLRAELAAGKRVVVDPDVFPGTSGGKDCNLRQATPTTAFCAGNQTDNVGWSGTSDSRALMQFNVQASVPRDVEVLEAHFTANLFSKTTTTGKAVGLYQVTRPWTASATWNTTDGTTAWAAAGGDVASTPADQQTMGATTGTQSWYPTQLVQDWADGVKQNYGLELKDVTANTTNNVLSFRSTNYTTDTSVQPKLEVYWLPRYGSYPGSKFDSQRLTDHMGVGVNLANGNLLVKNSDLQVSGTKLGLTVDRFYNSLQAVTEAFGMDWQIGVGTDVQLYVDADGHSVYLDGPSGYHKTFVHNADGSFTGPGELPAKLKQVDSQTYKLTYDKNQVTYTFKGCGSGCAEWMTQETDQNNNSITFNYDNVMTDPAHLTSIVDTQGRTFTVTNNASGFISQISDPTGRTWSYGYDTSNNLTTYTDPAGGVTHYAYDGWSDPIQITTPAGRVTKIAYMNPAGSDFRAKSVTRVTNTSTGAGDTTSYQYISTPAAPCKSTDFNETIVTDPKGNKTTYCFDQKDRATNAFDAAGHQRSTGYDKNGNVVQFQSAVGSSLQATSTATYDSNNNLTSVTDPTSVKGTAAYTDTGHPYSPTQSTNGQGSTFNYSYYGTGATAPGQPFQVTDKNNVPIFTFTYNSNGTIATAKDRNNNVTTYTYDAKGNLTKKAPPTLAAGTGTQQQPITYVPDALSRVSSRTNGNGKKTTYTYDALDRVKKITYADGSSMTYTYDLDGNLTSRADSNVNAALGVGTSTVVYDAKNRVTKETLPSSQINTYAYDANDNLTSLTDASGTASYGYDSLNELITLADPGGSCTASPQVDCTHFGYDSAGHRTTTTYPNSVTLTQTPDVSGRPMTIKAQNGAGTVLTSFSYTYTGNKQKTSTDKDGNKTTYTYSTDGYDRLADAKTLNSAGTQTDDYAYGYDTVGNILTQTHNGSTTTYGYNADNEICWKASGSFTSPSCAAAPTGATTYSYDGAGNEVSNSAGASYLYNARNQATSITTPAYPTAVTQTYGGEGQADLTSSSPRTFQSNITGIGIQRGGQWGDADFVHEPNGKLFSTLEAGRRHYYLFDALGSVVGLANDTGGSGGYFAYDPLGNQTQQVGQNVENYFYYAGGLFTNGVYHFGERYYYHHDGGWTQPDVMAHPTDPIQNNPYTYASDDPINFADPSGMISIGVDVSIGGVDVGAEVDTSGHVGVHYGETSGTDPSAQIGVSSEDVETGNRAEIGSCYGYACASASVNDRGKGAGEFGVGIGGGAEVRAVHEERLN